MSIEIHDKEEKNREMIVKFLWFMLNKKICGIIIEVID